MTKNSKNITRRSFIGTTGALTAGLTVLPGSIIGDVKRPGTLFDSKVMVPSEPTVKVNKQTGQISLRNGEIELIIKTESGLNPCSLKNIKTGRVYADTDYIWPGRLLPQLMVEPQVEHGNDGSISVMFQAKLNALEIWQKFSAPINNPGMLLETITTNNPTDQTISLSDFACGFAKRMKSKNGKIQDTSNARFTEIPYRIRPETGELCDYEIADIVSRQCWYAVDRMNWYAPGEVGKKGYSSIWGSEAWAWYTNTETLLIAKYNPDAMEWSLLQSVSAPDSKNTATKGSVPQALRFGGAGLWKFGDPEKITHLAPGEKFTFGTTLLQSINGGWKEAFYAFRAFTESKGHITPLKFNPLVQWNELYDNPLWWTPDGDTIANRQKYYRRADMQVEAEKAKEIGCESLYLDPGWDSSFASCIWAEDRLGKQEEFVKWIKKDYGLALALHTPLAAWCDENAYPLESRRTDEKGNRHSGFGCICSASYTYMNTKAQRLIELGNNGAYFLMFDGNWYPGTCYDPTHGHPVPMTRQDHLDAMLQLCKMVHKVHPDILIELHDPIIGPGVPRYAPTYILHGKPGSFNELWGYELMIHSLDDLLTRRAVTLYYVNLAYSIPIYLHVDLRKDNENALMFWWYASTCRHLGFGGKSSDPAIWQAQKIAMKDYLRLKQFFTQGEFYGIDEMTHVHSLRESNSSVVACFNLEKNRVDRTFRIKLPDIGLAEDKQYGIRGTHLFEREGNSLKINATINGRSACLLEILPK